MDTIWHVYDRDNACQCQCLNLTENNSGGLNVKLHYSSYVIYNGIAKEVIFVIKYTGMNKIKTGTHSHTGIVLNVFHEKSDEIDNIDFTISLQFGLLDLVAGDFLMTKL